MIQLILKLVLLQASKLPESHLNYGISLNLGETETLDEFRLGLVHSLRMTNDVNHLVYHVYRLQQTLYDMGTGLCLSQVELGSAHHHLVPEIHKAFEHILQGESAWATADQSHIINGKAGLKGRIFIESVQDHIGIGILLHYKFYPDTLTVSKFPNLGDTFYLLIPYHLSDAGYHLGLVHHIRHFGHHDYLTAVPFLDVSLSSYHHFSSTGSVGVHYALTSHNDASRREIRTLDMLHKPRYIYLRIVYIGTDGITTLSEIMRCHISSHTHGDTGRAVQEQERSLCRQNRRFLNGVIEVQGEIHRILVQIAEHALGYLCQFRFGVTHSGHRVAVHTTEVTLTEDQRISLIPILGKSSHGIIY